MTKVRMLYVWGFLSLGACRPIPDGMFGPCGEDSDCGPGLTCIVHPASAIADTDAPPTCNLLCSERRDCPNESRDGHWSCFEGVCAEYFPR